MEDDEKKDYRLHLINTIDNAIDNGISVYDLTIANKKALRHNYINKQVVIDKMEELKTKRRKLGFKTYLRREDMLNEDKMIVCKIEVLQELLERKK